MARPSRPGRIVAKTSAGSTRRNSRFSACNPSPVSTSSAGDRGRLGLDFLVDGGIDRFDRSVPRQRLINRAARLGVDARLQLPAFAARRQLGDQGKQIVAIVFVGAGQKGQPAVMLDDAVVIFGEAELAQRVVERPARGDEKHRDVQSAGGFWRFRSRPSLLLEPIEYKHQGVVRNRHHQPTRLSPSRLMRTSRWMPIFITRPNPNITVTRALPP